MSDLNLLTGDQFKDNRLCYQCRVEASRVKKALHEPVSNYASFSFICCSCHRTCDEPGKSVKERICSNCRFWISVVERITEQDRDKSFLSEAPVLTPGDEQFTQPLGIGSRSNLGSCAWIISGDRLHFACSRSFHPLLKDVAVSRDGRTWLYPECKIWKGPEVPEFWRPLLRNRWTIQVLTHEEATRRAEAISHLRMMAK